MAEHTRAENSLAEKDAEILSLKQKIDEYERQPELMADTATKALELLKRQDAEIASLRALVKELADALDDDPCFDCDSYREPCKCCSDRENVLALVAKAREVVNV